jgi:hypothetical protein
MCTAAIQVGADLVRRVQAAADQLSGLLIAEVQTSDIKKLEDLFL